MNRSMRKLMILATVCGGCVFQSGCSVADAILGTLGAVFQIVDIWA
ncbi:MAG: hypothetical protein JNG88_02485 [Phycisphaerales bacterium]|nr:hypothetical protein [Phycisphaerales bacterium]